MKKKLMCLALATILLVMAIPAFAYAPNPPFGWSSTVCRNLFTVHEGAWKEDEETWTRFWIMATEIEYTPSVSSNDVYLFARLVAKDSNGNFLTYLSDSSVLRVADSDDDWGGFINVDWDIVDQYSILSARIFNAHGSSYNMVSKGMCMFE